jgi:cytochrome d ubiquinol oxidase subunit I
MEGMWLYTGREVYYRHTRYWSRFFLLIFAVGVVSGIPLSFQFGANWERFSTATHGFFGHLLSFEAAMAFMLEAAFLGIMLWGWNRVPKGVHFFSTIMVALAASLSAFWIMTANSWMQTPAGGRFEDGRFILTDYLAAVNNPDMFLGVTHMWTACVEMVLFMIGGLSAWHILKNRHKDFFLKSFVVAVFAALIIAPLQFVLGDSSGRMIAEHQPSKLAATEAHWDSNPPGEPAGWHMIAWINEEEQKNEFTITIPYMLSLLIHHNLTGPIPGLKEFPRDEQPPVWLPFYSFRIMMAIGFGMIFLAFWTIWLWKKGRLRPEVVAEQRKTLWLWAATIPLGYVAIITGWITREVGRQPWIVYGEMRVEEAFTDLPAQAVATSLAGYILVYTVLFFLFIWFAWRIIKQGPPPPSAQKGEAG